MAASLRGISIQGREGISTRDGIRYRYTALVTTTDKNDGPEVVRQTAGIPKVGDLYNAGNDFNPSAIVTSVEPRQVKSPTEWEVEIVADTNVGQEPDEFDSPLDIPATVTYGFTPVRQKVWGFYDDSVSPDTNKDFTSSPLVSNGEPAVPHPTMEFDVPLITVQRNIQTLPFNFNDIAGAVNLLTFLGASPRQLRARTNARSLFHKDIGTYWQITVTFLYKFETWDLQLKNEGTFYIDADGTTKKREIVDGIPRIVELGSTGGLLAAGDSPTFTRLRVYREIDFGSLGLF